MSLNYKTRFETVTLPLFTSEGPSLYDVIQGDIGTCWFLSALTSYLRPGKSLELRKEDIRSLFEPTKILDRECVVVKINGQRIIVDFTVHWGRLGVRRRPLVCSWPILIEKSMLSIKTVNDMPRTKVSLSEGWLCTNIIPKCGEMKIAAEGLSLFVGPKSEWRPLSGEKASRIEEIYRVFIGGSHVLCNTGGRDPEHLASVNAIARHCYSIIDISFDGVYKLTVHNPWGCRPILSKSIPPHENSSKGTSTLTWREFFDIFSYIHVSMISL